MNKLFLAIIAAALSIQAAPHLINAYKFLSREIETRVIEAKRIKAAEIRKENAEEFCDSVVINFQQHKFESDTNPSVKKRGGLLDDYSDLYTRPVELATRESCISRFGTNNEYMPTWRKKQYP